jgi:2'-5' RNA ligase
MARGVIPLRWLHLTTQGVGFTDEVSVADPVRIGTEVAARLAGHGPVGVEIGPLAVDSEGINMPVRPVEPLNRVRDAIRDAIGAVRGTDAVPEGRTFHPHVSLAYAHTSGAPLAPLGDLADRHPDVIPATLTRVSLIALNRDQRMYTWTVVHEVPLPA